MDFSWETPASSGKRGIWGDFGPTEAKRNQETFSLKNSGDFFRKIVILDGNAKAWTDEEGIMYIGVIPFLLEEVPLNI